MRTQREGKPSASLWYLAKADLRKLIQVPPWVLALEGFSVLWLNTLITCDDDSVEIRESLKFPSITHLSLEHDSS